MRVKKNNKQHNNKNQNMMNIVFKPEGQLKEMGVQYSEKAQLGRPVNPNSKRQQRLANAPGRKTGRPIDPNSKRQKRLAELAAKAAANGGVVKRGRPINPNSKRQQAIAAAIEAAKQAEAAK